MDEKSRDLIAVITGDLVGFSDLPQEDRKKAPSVILDASVKAREQWGNDIPMDADVFGGDQWQIFIRPPKLALRVALFFRAHIISRIAKMDTRLAMAVGPVDFVSKERVSLSQGEAFTESGRLLMMRSEDPSRMWFVSPGHPEWEIWGLVFQCLGHLVRRHWTHANALAVTGALRGWKQEEIAELWTPPIRQPSVAGHLRAASWEVFEAALDGFENRHFGFVGVERAR
jgi:hypothetical protein